MISVYREACSSEGTEQLQYNVYSMFKDMLLKLKACLKNQ